MGRFGVDDKYVIKKVQKIRNYCYVLCFFYVWWKMVRTREPNMDARLQETLRFPS